MTNQTNNFDGSTKKLNEYLGSITKSMDNKQMIPIDR